MRCDGDASCCAESTASAAEGLLSGSCGPDTASQVTPRPLRPASQGRSHLLTISARDRLTLDTTATASFDLCYSSCSTRRHYVLGLSRSSICPVIITIITVAAECRKYWGRGVRKHGQIRSRVWGGGVCGEVVSPSRHGGPGIAPPENVWSNPAFGFVLGKKMCSATLDRNISTTSPKHYGVRDMALAPTSNIGGSSDPAAQPPLHHHEEIYVDLLQIIKHRCITKSDTVSTISHERLEQFW